MGWSPRTVQDFLDILEYDANIDPVNSVLMSGKANCLGGALTAAYLLKEEYGTEIMAFKVKDHVWHAVYIFQENSHFGSVGKSKDKRLEWRDPIYKTKEELYKSYLKYIENPDWWVTLDLRNLPSYIDWINDENINKKLWDIVVTKLIEKI